MPALTTDPEQNPWSARMTQLADIGFLAFWYVQFVDLDLERPAADTLNSLHSRVRELAHDTDCGDLPPLDELGALVAAWINSADAPNEPTAKAAMFAAARRLSLMR